MKNNSDEMREKIMLLLLAFSPVVGGFFFYILLQIPILGKFWLYTGPFLLLFYWGWVATVFQNRVKKLWKTVLFMNIFCILFYLSELVMLSMFPEASQTSSVMLFVQMFTMPLGFLTIWLGVLLSQSWQAETLTVTAIILSESISVLLLIIASVVGFRIGKKQDRKAMEDAEIIGVSES